MLSVIEESAVEKSFVCFAKTFAIFTVKISNRKGRKDTQRKTEDGTLYVSSRASSRDTLIALRTLRKSSRSLR